MSDGLQTLRHRLVPPNILLAVFAAHLVRVSTPFATLPVCRTRGSIKVETTGFAGFAGQRLLTGAAATHHSVCPLQHDMQPHTHILSIDTALFLTQSRINAEALH